jgi:hypothetical protein
MKRAHLLELRNAANAVRVLAPGLGPVSWADDLPDIVRASHLIELRSAVTQARGALGLATLAYSTPAPSAGSVVRTIQFEELRAAMR